MFPRYRNLVLNPPSIRAHQCSTKPIFVFPLFFFFLDTSNFQLLDKPWPQASSLLPGSCRQFSSRIGFSNITTWRRTHRPPFLVLQSDGSEGRVTEPQYIIKGCFCFFGWDQGAWWTLRAANYIPRGKVWSGGLSFGWH